MPEDENSQPHKRRVRYRGTHPRKFEEKYKELQPEKYADQIAKLIDQGQTPAGTHRPICVAEIMEILHPAPGETGFDATLGYGGHSLEMLKRLQPGGRLFAVDVDPIELPKTTERLARAGFGADCFFPHQMNFAGILKLLPETGYRGFDFLLADLGISSMQLDNPERGFTFKAPGPLDLRLNPARGKSVAAMLRDEWSAADLEKMLIQNADEPHARLLAEAIYEARETLTTTTALAQLIRQTIATGARGDIALATEKALQRTFQAFRIAVNGEFSVLEQFLQSLPFAVAPGGRIAILVFHSGEERRVAQAFRDGKAAGWYESISETPIRPGHEEIYSNSRAKCARLYWAIRGTSETLNSAQS